MILKAKNLLDKQAPYSFTSSSVAAGGTLFPVKNINQFYTSWAIQIGKTGEEKSEVLNITASAPTGTALFTTGTAKYDHPADTPVYAIKFDQVIFKRSTAGTSGTASAITNGTVTITPDSSDTIFDDTSGATSYGYKAQFRNSVTGDLSAESDWLTSSGYTFYSLHAIRERIKNKLFSASYVKSDSIVDDWINEWLEKMNNTAVNVNQDFNLGTMDVAYGTAGLGTITATDFKKIRRIWFTTDGVNYYNATNMAVTDFLPSETFNETFPYFYMLGDSVFGKKPEGIAGTARITYYRLGTTLTNETDELPVSMRGYTKSFADYGLANAYYLDAKDTTGDRFMGMANGELERFKNDIAPRDSTGPKTIRLTDPINADNYFEFI